MGREEIKTSSVDEVLALRSGESWASEVLGKQETHKADSIGSKYPLNWQRENCS